MDGCSSQDIPSAIVPQCWEFGPIQAVLLGLRTSRAKRGARCRNCANASGSAGRRFRTRRGRGGGTNNARVQLGTTEPTCGRSRPQLCWWWPSPPDRSGRTLTLRDAREIDPSAPQRVGKDECGRIQSALLGLCATKAKSRRAGWRRCSSRRLAAAAAAERASGN